MILSRSEDEILSTTYKKLTHKEHIKQLTDTYIGSTQTREEEMYILDNPDKEDAKIILKKIEYNPGLYKIVDEIIVNAFDQYIRLSTNQFNLKGKDLVQTTKIKLSIKNKTKPVISVYNNGNGIPIAKHPEHNQWIPELLFGELLTSTNYDFEADKVTAGKNGYGAKLTNIFSKKFTITTVDHLRKKKYIQTFSNNMEEKTEPIVTDTDEEPYTEFTFEPELKMLKLKEVNEGMISLMARRMYDFASCADKSVSFYYNSVKIKVKNFSDYIALYDTEEQTVDKINDRWEIGVAPTDTFQQISFVNGIYTKNGGTHVTYIVNQLVKGISEYMTKKFKEEIGGRTIKPQYIKDNIFVFIKATILNPSFDSQTKETLTTTPTAFGSTADISNDFIKKIVASGLGNRIIETINAKENALLIKQDKVVKTGLKIPKLDDANKAGSDEWDKCTLILTEGDSAKALAVSGLSIVGRDYYGVFPLKGKILNVREHKLTTVNNNEEIYNLKKIIGLEYGKKYDTLEGSGLRYRYVMIMADQDYDGSHIKGLFFNFIHFLWPELIIKHNFVRSLLTPIVKVSKNDKVVSFYNNKEYNLWKENNTGWNVKYYKGLGTNTAKEAKEYFSKIDINTINYIWDSGSENRLILAFDSSHADNRKQWLSHINEKEHEPIQQATQMNVSYKEFVDRELIYFSNYDNYRSIPSIVDGLKPAQRKILFAGFKKKLYSETEIKVAQFIGYISEHTSYHHGEMSLAGTIVAMAQDFTGSNNINLLEPSGQFGTRLSGGDDAASSRYIFTEFARYDKGKYITPLLFPLDDLPLLNYLDDDGLKIEPDFYVPILPMVLVNGTAGIGTGFSTKIPLYNPLDIIKNIYALMDGKEQTELIPWYRGFKGTITKNGDYYVTNGVYKIIDDTTIEITELPIGMWTDNYKEFLENAKADKDESLSIKKIINQSTEQDVKFIVKFDKKTLANLISNGTFSKMLRLHTSLKTSNMHLFNSAGNIKKYTTAEEIVAEFFPIRLNFYQKRKNYLLSQIKEEITMLESKKKYIEYIISDKMTLFKEKKHIVEKIKELKIKDYYNDEYKHLINMPAINFSSEKVTELNTSYTKKQEEYQQLENKTVLHIWKEELEKFVSAYMKFLTKK